MFKRWKLIVSVLAVASFIAVVLSGVSSRPRERLASGWTALKENVKPAMPVVSQAQTPQTPAQHHTPDEIDMILHPHHKSASGEECTANTFGSIPEPDTFANFKKAPGCDLTTAALHFNFEPKCADRKSLLTAMNSGGRHGLEAPYASLGCDFTWFTGDQVCEIMNRFDRLYFIGDSLMRQLVVAMHSIIRQDLVEGGRQSWRDDNPPEMDCRCSTLFARGSKCFWWEAIDTDALYLNVPESMPCGNIKGRISLQSRLAFPLPNDTWRDSIHGLTEKHTDGMKEVYVLGHGTWNTYDANATWNWLGSFEDAWREPVPWYINSPRLFISPSALSENKPARFLERGNNIMVQRFVHDVQPYLDEHGYEHLAPYNMTVQSMSGDGTHANLEASMIEAMFVINWLSML